MLLHEVPVHEVFVKHDVHHGHDELQVGSGTDGHPLVRLGGYLRVDGIDADDVRACFDGVGDEVPVLDLRVGEVVAPQEQVLRVHVVALIVARPRRAAVPEHAHDAVHVAGIERTAHRAGVDGAEQLARRAARGVVHA